ncbi:MAG TPA: YIP1 family protein [Silvibacterium sp.]|nr:YIP1 family protein [Silvibacterium sp.]
MNEMPQGAPVGAPLSETQRVVDAFVAPTITFTDLRRKATFWGPLIIMIIVGIGYSFSIQQKIGWEKVAENNIHQSPKTEERMATAPDGGAAGKAIAAKITAVVSYGYFVIVLIITALIALLNWATVNFGFGGKSTYGQIYAVSFYASLVMNIKFLLGIVAIFAGLAPDSFLINNPVGSNIGYYLSTDAPKWLIAFCTHLDLFEIWSLILSVIGVSIVARVSRGKAAVVVVGWWLVFVLIAVGAAAVQS